MPTLNIEIIFNSDSSQLNMRGPSEPLLCADVLLKAVQLCLVNAAKQKAAMKPPVEVAGAGLLDRLPTPEKKNGTP